MAQRLKKAELFENYFNTAKSVLTEFESIFGLNNVTEQFFGQPFVCGESGKEEINEPEKAMDIVKSSDAWTTLSSLYDYAVNGILAEHDFAEDIVIFSQQIISYMETYEHGLHPDWENLVAHGDGRFALDDGADLLLEKLSLLAGVDVRTVRNAISAGDLAAYKAKDGTYVSNESAREWLSNRRNFKPTSMVSRESLHVSTVSTPVEFAAFLKAQREKLGLEFDNKKLVFIHPSLSANSISEIESGVFKLPLDMVFPLADFYQIDKQIFLNLIMKVYFKEQLGMIQEEV